MLFPSTVDIHVTMLLTSFYPPSVSGSDSLIKWNPPLSLEIPPIGSATYPLGKWRDAVLAGKPWNTTDDERTSTCRIHYPPSQPKCLSMGPPGTQKKSKRGVNRWDRWDRLPFRRAYSMFDAYLQGLFYFLGGGRWDRSISLGKHFVLGKSLECGMWNVCQRVFLTKSPLSKPIKHEPRSIAKRSCSSEGAKESLTRQLTRCLHIVISEDLCVWHVLGIRNHF